MGMIKVNQKTCLQDGICAAECPRGIIEFRPDGYPEPSAGAEEMCIKCGHCVAVCPTGSLSHREMPAAKCPPVDEALKVSIEQCEHLFRSRRSIRVYKARPVPRDVLTRLIEIARYAPTGRNSQDVEWLVVAGRDKVQRLVEIGADWMRREISQNSELSPFLEVMLERREKGYDEFLRGAPAIVIAHSAGEYRLADVNGVIALTHLDLAANCLGLGCCWVGFFEQSVNTFPPMREALGLPEGHRVSGALLVGYPKFKYHRLPLRHPPRITWMP